MWSETAWGCGMTDWMTMWLKTSGATTNRLRFILLAGHPWLDILCSHPLVSVCRDAMMKYRTTLCSCVKRVWCVGITRPSRASRVVTRGMRVLHVKCVGSTRMKFMTSSVSLHLQDYLMKTWKIPLSYSGKKKKRGNDKPLRDRKTQGWGDLKRCTNDKYVRLDFFGIPKLHIFCMAPKLYNQFFALSRKTLQECLRSR